MKKVINGKVYDTATAERIGEWDNGYYPNDFNYCSETLYRKRTGEFFIHGAGHAMSRYATHHGNSSGWGETIFSVSYEDAQEWVEEHLSADTYEKLFGIDEEDESRTRVNISLENSVIAKAKQDAGKLGLSVSEYIANLIKNA